MKLKIGDKIYDTGVLDDLPLKFILQMEKQTADFGHPMTYPLIKAASDEINALKSDDEKKDHPEMIWLTAVGIWAARKLAGEDVTFDQAVDFPMSALTVLPEPGDHKKPNPTKGRPRKGSGPAVKPAGA